MSRSFLKVLPALALSIVFESCLSLSLIHI